MSTRQSYVCALEAAVSLDSSSNDESGCIDLETAISDFTLTNTFDEKKGPIEEKAAAERGSETTTTDKLGT